MGWRPGCIPYTSHAEDTPRVWKFHAKRPGPKGRAFRNIGTEKYISLTIKSALLLYYLFYNLLRIRSFTTGSGTFILSRWSLLVQLLVFTDFEGVRTRRQFVALKVLTTRGVWGHAPPESFQIWGPGNAISCYFHEIFLINK